MARKNDGTDQEGTVDVPELSPARGGSYVRHPETGELQPNADDHVMAARQAAEAAATPAPIVNAGGN